MPAAAELLALDRLREFSGAPFDPATTRGTLSAQVELGMPLRPDLPKGSTEYNITVDLTNFTAEKMMFGQKVEAQTLQLIANNQRYEIKGDVKIGGAPAELEYRKAARRGRRRGQRAGDARRGGARAARVRPRQHASPARCR